MWFIKKTHISLVRTKLDEFVHQVCKSYDSPALFDWLLKDQNIGLYYHASNAATSGCYNLCKHMITTKKLLGDQISTFCAKKPGTLEFLKFCQQRGNFGNFFSVAMEPIISKACEGPVELVAWLHESVRIPLNSTCYDVALKDGNLETVEYLFQKGCKTKKRQTSFFGNAAISGNLKLLEWLESHKFEKEDATEFAAQHGKFEVLKWFTERGFPKGKSTSRNLAKHGNLEILKWAHENGFPFDDSCFETGVESKNHEILEFLSSLKLTPTSHSVVIAGEQNDMKLVKWLIELGGPPEPSLLPFCDLPTQKWLHEILGIKYPIHFKTGNYLYKFRAEKGDLDAIKYMQEKCGTNFLHKSIAYDSIPSGNLQLIQWLHKKGCNFSHFHMVELAKQGDLEILKFLREVGTPMNYRSCAIGAWRSGHFKTARWIEQIEKEEEEEATRNFQSLF